MSAASQITWDDAKNATPQVKWDAIPAPAPTTQEQVDKLKPMGTWDYLKGEARGLGELAKGTLAGGAKTISDFGQTLTGNPIAGEGAVKDVGGMLAPLNPLPWITHPVENAKVLYHGIQDPETFAQGIGTGAMTVAPFAKSVLPPSLSRGLRSMANPEPPAIPGRLTSLVNPQRTMDIAGRNFETAMGKAGDVPIDVGQPAAVAERVYQLGGRGNSMPRVIRQFYNRVTDPDKPPMTYRESRDFASSASRLSADEMNRLTPQMKKLVGDFSRSLNEANEQAAAKAGVQPEYQAAMKGYARGAGMKDVRQAAKADAVKHVLKPLGWGAAAGAGYELLRKALFR